MGPNGNAGSLHLAPGRMVHIHPTRGTHEFCMPLIKKVVQRARDAQHQEVAITEGLITYAWVVDDPKALIAALRRQLGVRRISVRS